MSVYEVKIRYDAEAETVQGQLIKDNMEIATTVERLEAMEKAYDTYSPARDLVEMLYCIIREAIDERRKQEE